MFAVRLDAELEARLDAMVKYTGRSRSQIMREALASKIDEIEEIAGLEARLRDPEFRKKVTQLDWPVD